MRDRPFCFLRGALCCLALLAVGCKSYVDVKVTSEPTSATVLLDGESQGDTPCEVRLFKDNGVHYMFLEKRGYDRVQKVFRYNKYPETLHVEMPPAPPPK